MKNRRTQSLTLILSLLLHASLALVLILHPNFESRRKQNRITEVELVEPKDLLNAFKELDQQSKGQIVEQDETRLNDEIDKDTKFLSKHDQKVVREMQAAVHGKFKNTDGTAGEKKPEKKIGQQNKPVEEKANEPAKQIFSSPDGLVHKTKPLIKSLVPSFKPVPPLSETLAQSGGEGPSATDDHLKDVAKGMQTLLSTREFVYYSYYNRIKDKLRQYWEPKIKEKMERIVRQGRNIASNTDRITKIVIVLDPNGTLVRVQIIGPSGVNDLDDAAVEAFRAAAPFPNPPKGIVDSDGTIKIRWDFILEAEAGDSLMRAMRLARVQEE